MLEENKIYNEDCIKGMSKIESGGAEITRRLGCLCCPLKSYKKRLEDFRRYPKMLRQYIRNTKVYFDEHPNSKVHEWAADIYEWVFAEIMCPSHKKYMEQYKNGLFQIEDGWHKKKLEEYFNVNLDL